MEFSGGSKMRTELIIFGLLVYINMDWCTGERPHFPGAKTKKNKETGSNKTYWTPKPDQVAEWQSWLDKVNAKEKEKKKKKKAGDAGNATISDPMPGAPDGWPDLESGDSGMEVPPWAIVSDGGPKPRYCFFESDKGNCKGNETRYGFNPYTQECESFTYSGCDGNENNFTSKKTCEETCKQQYKGQCTGA